MQRSPSTEARMRTVKRNRVTALEPYRNWSVGIRAVVKQTLARVRIDSQAMNMVNNILNSIARELVAISVTLAENNRLRTLSSREIMTAYRLLSHNSSPAISYAVKALTKYVQSFGGLPAPVPAAPGPGGYAKPQKTSKVSRSQRAGISISVSVADNLVRSITKLRVSSGYSVALAAILEDLVRDIAMGASNVVVNDKKSTITQKSIHHAIAGDQNLTEIIKDLNIQLDASTVIPNIHPFFIPKKPGRRSHKK